MNWSMSNHNNAHMHSTSTVCDYTACVASQADQLDKPHADAMLNQQKAVKPRTQDSQRKSL